MKTKVREPLVELPEEADVCLYLIKEELKSWKFFNSLRQAGLDGSAYQTDLSSAILTLAGLADQSNELALFYFRLMEKLSAEMKPDEDDMIRCALVAYGELISRVEMKNTKVA